MKTNVFEIESLNFVSKPLKGRGGAWWRSSGRMGHRKPLSAAPKGPFTAPKEPLSHKTPSFVSKPLKIKKLPPFLSEAYIQNLNLPS